MSKRKEPGRSAEVEKLLQESGFDYLYMPDVSLEDFDEDGSLHNQVRDEPVDEVVVELYANGVGNGDDFPAVVAAPQPGTAGYRIYDGNHRYQAFKARNRKTIPTYLVTDGSQLGLLALANRINSRHGKATSEKERLRQAVWLCDAGETAENAARQLGLTAAKVRAELNRADAARRALDLEVDARRWDNLSASAQTRLAQVTTDEAFGALAELTLAAGLSSSEVAEAVKAVNGIRSAAKQVEYVTELRRGDYARRIQHGGRTDGQVSRGGQKQRPTARLGQIFGALMALPEPDTLVGTLSESEREHWLERLDRLQQRLTEYQKRLHE